MKRKQLSVGQIAAVLKQAEVGDPVAELQKGMAARGTVASRFQPVACGRAARR